MMSHRQAGDFWRTSAAAGFHLGGGRPGAVEGGNAKRPPNIILILSDDPRQRTGVLRNRVHQTPTDSPRHG